MWSAFCVAGSQSQARVLTLEKCCSDPSPQDVCAAQPGFLRILLAGCWPPPRAAGSSRLQAAGDTGRAGSLWQAAQGGSPTANSQEVVEREHKPPPTPLAGDAAGHASHRFKRRRRGLSVMEGGRGLLEMGKGKRGPGAGDKVQPSHTGRSGQTKTGTGRWLLAGTAALLLPGGQWARQLQTASERTVAHSVQTSCGPKQHWDFHPVQCSANAKLKETAQASSSSPQDTNSLLESNHFSQQDPSLEPNISSTLGELRRVSPPPTNPSKLQQMSLQQCVNQICPLAMIARRRDLTECPVQCWKGQERGEIACFSMGKDGASQISTGIYSYAFHC